MAPHFLAGDREQAFLLPPDVRDWLAEGLFAWFVSEAVAEMDLAAFYGAYRQDGHGRAAFDPERGLDQSGPTELVDESPALSARRCCVGRRGAAGERRDAASKAGARRAGAVGATRAAGPWDA
jgi:hypothetical protein